ncbi:MAG TPA: DMT family transporter [Micromonosporaceae bacterium]
MSTVSVRRPPTQAAVLPAWAALTVAGLGGLTAAVQSVANAELGERVDNPALAGVINNVGGSLVLIAALLVVPSIRAGLAVLPRAGLPWWAYLGGLGGACIVLAAAYVVPVLGVAAFTIAQVTGNSVGGLAVDRVGLGPVGRLSLSGPRVAGAALGVLAVALAHAGQPIGDLALGAVLFAVLGGAAVALQAALNGRIAAVAGAAAGTAVNFAVGTPAVIAVAAALGAFARLDAIRWPTDWYLYAGGLLGVAIVLVLQLAVRSVGVLRTGLAIVAGQLGGALLLDAVLPGGPGVSVPVLAGALLTFAAVVVSGRGGRSAIGARRSGTLGR